MHIYIYIILTSSPVPALEPRRTFPTNESTPCAALTTPRSAAKKNRIHIS